jgi:hypothetical protein
MATSVEETQAELCSMHQYNELHRNTQYSHVGNETVVPIYALKKPTVTVNIMKCYRNTFQLYHRHTIFNLVQE